MSVRRRQREDIRRYVCPGHFTQLVWKGSREVGIGRAQSRDGKWFVVANFFPAGNYIGRNAENVLPSRDGKVSVTAPVANNSNFAPQGIESKQLQKLHHFLPTPDGWKPELT